MVYPSPSSARRTGATKSGAAETFSCVMCRGSIHWYSPSNHPGTARRSDDLWASATAAVMSHRRALSGRFGTRARIRSIRVSRMCCQFTDGIACRSGYAGITCLGEVGGVAIRIPMTVRSWFWKRRMPSSNVTNPTRK